MVTSHTHSLRTIDNLQPGDHLCCIYQTDEEHRSVVTPYLSKGLAQGEKVLYIVDTHTSDSILGYLRNDGVEVEQYLAKGQLLIFTRDDAYMQHGLFDPNRMIALLKTETERSSAEGYHALRITGEMTWALKGLPGSERLIEYEIMLNAFLPGSRCLAICQYDKRRFRPEVLLDVLKTHPFAVVGTEIYENFYYMPPEELLGDNLPAVTLKNWIENLAKHKQAEKERNNLIHKLQDALASVKTLSGLLPICASCKKVRDDQGYWTQIEAYISDHSGAEFSHGLCPECTKKFYDDYEKLKQDMP